MSDKAIQIETDSAPLMLHLARMAGIPIGHFRRMVLVLEVDKEPVLYTKGFVLKHEVGADQPLPEIQPEVVEADVVVGDDCTVTERIDRVGQCNASSAKSGHRCIRQMGHIGFHSHIPCLLPVGDTQCSLWKGHEGSCIAPQPPSRIDTTAQHNTRWRTSVAKPSRQPCTRSHSFGRCDLEEGHDGRCGWVGGD